VSDDRRAHSRRRRLVLSAIALSLGFVAILSLVGSASAAVDTDALCDAYEKLQLDPTNTKVIRKQAGRMADAKPPQKVKKALGVIKAAAAGDISPTSASVVAATSTLASYVSTECSSSGGTGSSGGSTSTTSRCPLTEEQVSAAVGVQLSVDQASCTFFPTDDAWPNVVFVRQVAFACDANIRSEVGYSEQLDGLRVKAYVQRETAEGAMILVCDKPPFEIAVDIPGDSAGAFAAAQKLAAQVLQSS
jgi:hypothetical protein